VSAQAPLSQTVTWRRNRPGLRRNKFSAKVQESCRVNLKPLALRELFRQPGAPSLSCWIRREMSASKSSTLSTRAKSNNSITRIWLVRRGRKLSLACLAPPARRRGSFTKIGEFWARVSTGSRVPSWVLRSHRNSADSLTSRIHHQCFQKDRVGILAASESGSGYHGRFGRQKV